MSTNTSIEWATKTWGPVLGCKKVSAGCDNCYAIRTAHRLAANPNPKLHDAYEGLTEYTESGLDWTGVVRTLPERLTDPMKWRKAERIFVNSQSDLFHPAIGMDFTARVWATMAATRRHTYQVLTKRPDVALKMLSDPAFLDLVGAHLAAMPGSVLGRPVWPLRNAWIGVSVEDQKTADLRIPTLLRTPAAVRWISAEPLLGPIDLDQPRCESHDRDAIGTDAAGREWCTACSADGFSGELSYWHWLDPLNGGLQWVVIGGESGPGARPMHPAWARSLRDQCEAASVPMLLKQRGAWTWTSRPGDPWDDREPDLWVEESDGRVADEAAAVAAGGSWCGVYRVGKKAAGRELDGVLHDAYPAVAP